MKFLQSRKNKEKLIVGSVIIISLIIFFFPVLFQGKILLGADTLFKLPPWQALAEPDFKVSSTLATDTLDNYTHLTYVVNQIKVGNLFPWNPYIAGGQSFHFLTFQLLLYPLNWLFLLFPVENALGYHALLRLLLTGIFTYLFTRRIGLNLIGSLIAVIILMFNGFMIVWLGWQHTYVMAALPLNLWLLDKLLTRPRIPTAIALSFATLFLFTGGFPPITVYGLCFLGSYAIYKLVSDFHSSHKLKEVWTKGLICLGAIGGGLLLSAVYIDPLVASLAQSGYTAERAADPQLYSAYHFPLHHLITYLIPEYYGNNSTDAFWGVSNYIESTGYVGIISLLLVPFGLINPRQRGLSLFFVGILAISVGIIYGFPPLQWIIAKLPGFNALINTRLLSINALALAILAGAGIDFLTRLPLKNSGQTRKNAWIVMISTGFVLYLVIIFVEVYWNSIPGTTISYGEDGNPFGPSSVTKRTLYLALLNRDITHLKQFALFAFWLGFGLASISLYLRKKIPVILFSSTVLILIIADLFSFGISFNVAVDPAFVFPTTSSIKKLQTEYQHSPFRILALDRLLYGNTSLAYELSNVGGHSLTHPKRYTRFLQHINSDVWNRRKHGTLLYFGQDNTNLNSNLINLLNVKYVLQGNGSCEVAGNKMDVSQTTANAPAGEIWGENIVGQTFLASEDDLSQICLFVATYQRSNHQDLIFHLQESPNSEYLVTEQVNASAFLDNSWYSFTFPPIANSANKTFYFSLESPMSEPGNAITVWTSKEDVYTNGSQINGGNPATGDLAFITYGIDKTTDSSQYMATHNPDMTIYQNSNYLPKAYFAPQAIILDNEKVILDRLTSSQFNPNEYVILEESPSIAFDHYLEKNIDEALTKVNIVSYEPNYVQLQIDAPTDGFVILGDLFHPSWTALIDGQEQKIYQANYLFRAIQIPPGSHEIEFIFEPDIWTVGTYISLITFVLLILVSFIYLLARKKWINASILI